MTSNAMACEAISLSRAFRLRSQTQVYTDIHGPDFIAGCMRLGIMRSWHPQLEGVTMATLMIRNLPDAVYRALRVRAAQHGATIEAEVCEILVAALNPDARVRIGDALAALGRKIGLTDEDFEVMQEVRDKAPAKAPGFV